MRLRHPTLRPQPKNNVIWRTRSSRPKDRLAFLPPAILLLAFLLPGCRPAAEPTPEPGIALAVSSSLEPAALALIEAFNLVVHRGSPLAINTAGTDSTPASGAGDAMILTWREPPADDWSALIGWTGIAFVVHPDNPLSDLSSAEAADIFRGWIGRWEDTGGSPGDIHPIVYAGDSDIAAMFGQYVLGGYRPAGAATVVPSAAAMRSAVAGDPSAVGFQMAFEPAEGLRVLTVNGTTPAYAEFLSGEYPFRIPIYLTTGDPPAADVEQFAGWAQSVAGQTILMRLQ